MNIYVWGIGRLNGQVVGRYIKLDDITAFIDNDENKTSWQGKPVIRPQAMKKRQYDAILVTTLHSYEVYSQCQELGIDLKKVGFLWQNLILQDMNQNYELLVKILGEEYVHLVKNRYQLIRKVELESPVYRTCIPGGVLLDGLCENAVFFPCSSGNLQQSYSRRCC